MHSKIGALFLLPMSQGPGKYRKALRRRRWQHYRQARQPNRSSIRPNRRTRRKTSAKPSAWVRKSSIR